MSRVLVVRHGESTWNAEGRWQGQADPPLSPEGVAQARAAAAALGPVGGIATSDLSRASATAAILGKKSGAPVREDRRWRERRAGPWEGSTRAQIEAAWPGYLGDGRRPPGFEGDDVVAVRALDALAAAAAAGETLVVTHSGVLRALVAHLGGTVRGPLHNLSGWWFVGEGTRFSIGPAVSLVGEGVSAEGEKPVE